MAPGTQWEVAQPPNDAISSLEFAPESSKLIVSSWDKNVYLYDIGANGADEATLIRSFEFRAPVLDVCFGANDDEAFVGGLDQQVYKLDLTTGEQTALSQHNAAVRSLAYSREHSILVSASWDLTLHIHDTSSSPSAPQPTITIQLPGKPHAMASSPSKLVVAMTARLVHIYDLPTLSKALQSQTPASEITPWQQRESSLKFLTRAVACMPNDAGYATSSIEGRVAVEWFEDTEASQARKYAFKCHRQAANDEEGGDIVYPVNALAFHPKFGTFASGGGDASVALWDAEAKRRMRQLTKFPDSVAALAFSGDGKFLAIGACPGFQTGMEDYSGEGRTHIVIRELGETEAKGKGPKEK
ncbi:WD40-repeat-containing domain protein [Rhypophila decipiens]